MSKSLVLLVIAVVLVYLTLLWWIKYEDPYQLLEWWNTIIDHRCHIQDLELREPAPSYCSAQNSKNASIRKLDSLIQKHHDQILQEALHAMAVGAGVPMVDIDLTQSKLFDRGWRPIWVKFLSGYASSADLMPTLKSICQKIEGLNLLHVSVMMPGTVLNLHRGPSRAVLRYHYGLLIPAGNTGLYIQGKKIGWNTGHGFTWDDTLLHGSWNRTSKPRLVIFADVRRDLGWFYNLGTSLIFWIIARTDTTTKAFSKLEGYIQSSAPTSNERS